MRLLPTSQRRPAFTLVEMMVSTALIIFMMYILANAFEKGLGAFRVLKTASDMQDKLRGAATIIRQDLSQQHFDDGGKYLGDQRLDSPDWAPPRKGYFRIYLEGPGQIEGLDPDDPGGSMKHYRSPGPTDNGHVLQFTVKLEGIRQDQFFTVDTQDPINGLALHMKSKPTYTVGVGPTRFSTEWAEITYFVKRNGQTTDGTVPLYTLYRRQNLLVPDGSDTGLPSFPATDPRYAEISGWQTNNKFNGPEEVTAPMRRFGVPPTSPAGAFSPTTLIPLSGAHTASDQLLTNVLNWEIKMLWDPSAAIAQRPSGKDNPDFPFDHHPFLIPTKNSVYRAAGVKAFDTWSQWKSPIPGSPDDYVGPNNASPLWRQEIDTGTPTPHSLPLKIRVRALQIELRIWDPKSKTTRQMTIFQDV